MNIETWSTMTKKARENWHRREIEKACQELGTKALVKKSMLTKNFGTDLNSIYTTMSEFLTLPD